MSCWEPRDLCEAAYISVNAHNVAISLQAGSLPSGLLNVGRCPPSAPGTGSRPLPLPLFSKSRVLGKFGGAFFILFLQGVNRESLFPPRGRLL